MLIQIDPILSPEILYTLRAMGHGDRLVLCDSNFPAYSTNDNVHRLDGVNAARAAKAILSVFPLDSFIPSPFATAGPKFAHRPHQNGAFTKTRTLHGGYKPTPR